MGTPPRNKSVHRSQPGQATVVVPRRLSPVGPTKPTKKQSLLLQKSFWLTIGLLLLSASALAASGWFALQLIVNPQSLSWVNRLLPNWIPVGVSGANRPQTLAEIQTEIRKIDRIPGDPLTLGKNKSSLDHKTPVSDLLLPIWQRQPACQNNCDRIVELRLYQSLPTTQPALTTPVRFQLVQQLPIAGPEESFVIAPLVDARSLNQGSSRALPLTTLTPFEGKVPKQGVWLNLSGVLNRADYTIAYGEILHYNPSRLHLGALLEWNSTTGELPQWREVTGGGLPELVVDQTVGMEPQFKVYQVKPRNFVPNPIHLEPIGLMDSALTDLTYQKGLLFARQGLWSIGREWMTSAKRSRKTWSAAAQAQLDLVHLHALATQEQAAKSWASPNQQVLANLIDGRWQRALQVFNANFENRLETDALLKADGGQLQNRIEIALQINPAQPEVKTWGALLVAAQSNKGKAIVWLKKQPRTTPREIARIGQLIDQLNQNDNHL